MDMRADKENLGSLLEKFNLSLDFEISEHKNPAPTISKKRIVELFGKHQFFVTILNGQFKRDLSALPPNVHITNLSDTSASELRSDFNNHVAVKNLNVFAGSKLIKNGFLMVAEKGTAIRNSVYVYYINSFEHSCLNELRKIYVFKEGCSIDLIEQFYCPDDLPPPQINNIVSEFNCEKNSSVKICRVSRMLDHVSSKNICHSFVNLFEKSDFSFFDFTPNVAWTNNNISVLLSETLARCNLYSISFLNGEQGIENNIYVNHKAPNCYSRQIYKGVFDGEARGFFDSCVLVSKKAQKTIAIQQNNNIILSDYAFVKSNPQLEIFADDVECSHGSTVGQIDEKALFYLRSRGVSERVAYNILLKAFFSDVIEKIKNPIVEKLVLLDLDKKLKLRE